MGGFFVGPATVRCQNRLLKATGKRAHLRGVADRNGLSWTRPIFPRRGKEWKGLGCPHCPGAIPQPQSVSAQLYRAFSAVFPGFPSPYDYWIGFFLFKPID